jgi:predicted ATPase
MRAALEWSLDLLGPQERQLFSRLAAFALTGTIDAASDVCGTAPLTKAAVPGLMRRLVRASLLSVGDDAGRWSMLSSVHELAALEMGERAEAHELPARHRSWFARHVEMVEPHLGLRGHGEVMSDLLADIDNIRKSLASAARAGDSDCALRIATGMTPFWMSHGDWAEGIVHLEAAIAPARWDGAAARTRPRRTWQLVAAAG